jgi:superfamily II DNA or RNA helicase
VVLKNLTDYIPLFKTYSANFEYFGQYQQQHRQHQLEAIEASDAATIGQILSPCGTGKTRIQISIHVKDMIAKSQQEQCGTYLIASHRLALNVQLFNQLLNVCIKCGLSFNILFVGSYHYDEKSLYGEYAHLGFNKDNCRCLATTNKKEIERFIELSRNDNRHVIIVSTYDSFAQLKDIGEINICTYDEAHNTIEQDFTANINQVKPIIKREYFFTATRKVRGEDDGMNDKTFYGEVSHDAFPSLMLARGEICCPRIHTIDSKSGTDETNIDNLTMLVKNILEGFETHRKYLKDYSNNPDLISPTLLVSCAGIEEMMRIYNHPTFKSYVNNNHVKALSISSDGCFFNYDKCSKQNFLTHLNNIKDTEESIIFNVDMLTEGIDLPSITGVMPLRNLGATKLIQLLGRCLRLHKLDRKALYSKEFPPEQRNNYIKPYGHLIIPRHLTSLNEHKAMLNKVKEIINEYKTSAEEIVIQEKFIDPGYDDLKSIIDYPLNGGKNFELIHDSFGIVSELNIESFEKEVAKSGQGFLIKMLKNFKEENGAIKTQE